MRKIFYLFFISTLILSCEKAPEANYVLLSGKMEHAKAKAFVISGEGFKKNISLAEDGSFADTLYLEENGYYNLRSGRTYTSLFLENGYELTLTIDPENKEKTFTYTGTGQEVNTYLFSKQSLQNTLRGNPEVLYAMNEDDYRNKQQSIKKSLDSLLASSNLDKNFEKLEKDNIFYAYGSELLKFAPFHEYYAKKENYQVSEGFHDEIKDLNYNDDMAYSQIPSYRELVMQNFGMTHSEYYKETNNSISKTFVLATKDIPKGKIKDAIMNNYIGFSLTADENMDLVYNTFMENVQNEEYKAAATKKYETIQKLVPGKPSPSFNYENHKGGKTTLADLKGKYVYIDVWATWCGPCKAEIPSLKKLEADYHGKNIEFVSISIDSKRDYETWKNMVNEEALGGIQLIADNDWKSQFVADYAIGGIPRFILIDPDGNIVHSDAPRPSDKKIRDVLNTLKI